MNQPFAPWAVTPWAVTRWAVTRWAVPILCAFMLSACYPYPAYYPAPAPGPSSFDRSWDAAIGAAADAGVQVSAADRTSGRIVGIKGSAAVTIVLQGLPDGRLQVTFNAPDSPETNPTLSQRLREAYDRRMGR